MISDSIKAKKDTIKDDQKIVEKRKSTIASKYESSRMGTFLRPVLEPPRQSHEPSDDDLDEILDPEQIDVDEEDLDQEQIQIDHHILKS